MFIGTYEHALDEKNRLMVPAKLREGVPADESGAFYLTLGLDGCLFAFTVKSFEALVERFRTGKSVLAKKSARDFVRTLFGNARMVEVDAAGRILLPDGLRDDAGIRRDVVLAGVMDRIEIWDRQAWMRRERANRPRFERHAEESELFG